MSSRLKKASGTFQHLRNFIAFPVYPMFQTAFSTDCQASLELMELQSFAMPAIYMEAGE
jgi:hypothetical protein